MCHFALQQTIIRNMNKVKQSTSDIWFGSLTHELCTKQIFIYLFFLNHVVFKMFEYSNVQLSDDIRYQRVCSLAQRRRMLNHIQSMFLQNRYWHVSQYFRFSFFTVSDTFSLTYFRGITSKEEMNHPQMSLCNYEEIIKIIR